MAEDYQAPYSTDSGPGKNKEANAVHKYRSEVEGAKKNMEPVHKEWEDLHDRYRLKFELEDYTDDEVIKISRMYPLARNILSAIAFNHPRTAITPKPLVENANVDLSMVSRIVERAVNQAMEIIDVKREVHQAVFDMLFCGCGWLKMAYNPPGKDGMAPYSLNDRFQDDFAVVLRVDPRKMFVSPLTPPNNLGLCPVLYEEMDVPLDVLLDDPDIEEKAKRKLREKDRNGDYGNEEGELPKDSDNVHPDGEDGKREAKSREKLVRVWEVHDRAKKKLFVIADGVDCFLKDTIHPFIEKEYVEAEPSEEDLYKEPMPDGEPALEPMPTGGFIFKDGFQYIPLKIDMDMDSFIPKPPMAYIEGPEKVQVENITRVNDQQKRFSRMVAISQAEEDNDAEIRNKIEKGKDGEVITLKDINNLKEINFSTSATESEQVLERAKSYEAESLHIGDTSLARGASRKTAAEVTLSASTGTMTREWMQESIALGYKTFVYNLLRMWRDIDFIPDKFIENIASDFDFPVAELLTQEIFQFEFYIDIDVLSIQPFVAQRDFEEATMLYDRFIGDTDIDQEELKKMLLKSMRVRSWERLFRGKGKAEATLHAEKENIAFLSQGQDPGVDPNEDHQVHMQVHQQIDLSQVPPELQDAVVQVTNQHLAQHFQAMQTSNKMGGNSASLGVDGKLQSPGGQGLGSAESAIRSAGQGFNDAIERDVNNASPT